MKSDPNKNRVSKLSRIGEELKVLEQPESRSAFLKSLDSLIASLSRLRAGLTHPSIEGKAAEIREPLEQVIGFLEFAKTDESLKTLFSPARKTPNPKPKRQPIEIPSNLANEQIRALLEKDLSRAELKLVAGQRGISVGKSNNEEIKRDILRTLERQEGYVRLASSGS
jgi:hypothetical protein